MQLMAGTDADGNYGTDFGPYLSCFPPNPFNGSTRVWIDSDGTRTPGKHRADGPDACGWYFNAVTGHFAANDSIEHGRL